MRILFAATSQFALPALNTLLHRHTIAAVITKPDAPSGRGKKLRPSPIKDGAQKHGILIFDKSIQELVYALREIKPDILVVAAYGAIIPLGVLAIPRYGALNIHPSLLPKYRGASPIQAAILNGDTETGVTVIRLTKELDAGPIISQKKITLFPKITAGLLHDELADLGAELLQETLEKGPPFNEILQNESRASYTKKITPLDAELDCKKSAVILERKVRAYNPAPGAYITITNHQLRMTDKSRSINKQKTLRLKIWRAEIKKDAPQFSEGAPFIIDDGCPALMCADRQLLLLTEVQPEGRKRMRGVDFANGYLSAQP